MTDAAAPPPGLSPCIAETYANLLEVKNDAADVVRESTERGIEEITLTYVEYLDRETVRLCGLWRTPCAPPTTDEMKALVAALRPHFPTLLLKPKQMGIMYMIRARLKAKRRVTGRARKPTKRMTL